ncbi:phytoene/squalene synthase family protein [Naasia aerilata]|uniref:Phytoene synthase n=1 Tax=Naasia aerilata TaxID=1162966 RepID=A0ABN6XPH1_9MICO|nr:squalene/phytoene synthase family protein [Naasia aerilata]BDZ45323.1 phytoene synthase [Naasia aerilata]
MTPLELYGRAADEAAATVIRRYSTSFGLASRLLSTRNRVHVQNIYALVRVADEIVDGVAAAAGLPGSAVAAQLDALEADVEQAIGSGYSSNLIVHAFARTARANRFGTELTRPFFASMRADLTAAEHTPESFAEYVYGSAEVVGLMCLAAFLEGRPASQRLEQGARALGAAFQKVNFLRDLSADYDGLGRSYFPGVTITALDEETKNRLLDDLDADLAVAAAVLGQLPRGSRHAVGVAQRLFAELSARLRRTPAEQLRSRRVRVPDPVKLRLVAAELSGVRRA